ncbi:SH3 domain-containing protein [Dapis sp. BLCC M126]|uniref:SH3 domain-containing protein n=1 Tax=Dapis sp. BLCC M126 TaxID=3400189 RepID=UPI003CE7550B
MARISFAAEWAIAPIIPSLIQTTPRANAQSLGTNAEVLGHWRGSQKINIHLSPDLSSQVIDSVTVGDYVIILNEGDPVSGPYPLRQVDTRGQNWYAIVKTREGKPEGIIPAKDRGWISEDFLQLRCPP